MIFLSAVCGQRLISSDRAIVDDNSLLILFAISFNLALDLMLI